MPRLPTRFDFTSLCACPEPPFPRLCTEDTLGAKTTPEAKAKVLAAQKTAAEARRRYYYEEGGSSGSRAERGGAGEASRMVDGVVAKEWGAMPLSEGAEGEETFTGWWGEEEGRGEVARSKLVSLLENVSPMDDSEAIVTRYKGFR